MTTGRPNPLPGSVREPETKLVSLVLRRRDLAARLAALSRVQSARIAAGDHQTAVEVLAEREGIIGEVAAISEELRRERGALARVIAGLPSPAAQRLQAMIDESESLLDEVTERDAADLAAMEAERATVGEGLAGNARARAAVGAYGGRVGPRVQDREV